MIGILEIRVDKPELSGIVTADRGYETDGYSNWESYNGEDRKVSGKGHYDYGGDWQ